MLVEGTVLDLFPWKAEIQLLYNIHKPPRWMWIFKVGVFFIAQKDEKFQTGTKCYYKATQRWIIFKNVMTKCQYIFTLTEKTVILCSVLVPL